MKSYQNNPRLSMTHFSQRLFLECLWPEGDALTLEAALSCVNVEVTATGVAAADLTIPHPVPAHHMSCHTYNDGLRPGPPGDAEQEALDVPGVTEVAGGDSLLDDGAVPQS